MNFKASPKQIQIRYGMVLSQSVEVLMSLRYVWKGVTQSFKLLRESWRVKNMLLKHELTQLSTSKIRHFQHDIVVECYLEFDIKGELHVDFVFWNGQKVDVDIITRLLHRLLYRIRPKCRVTKKNQCYVSTFLGYRHIGVNKGGFGIKRCNERNFMENYSG